MSVVVISSTGQVHAQNSLVSAQIDKPNLTTNEVVTLTVIINNSTDTSTPLLPVLDGFDIGKRSTKSSINIINGVTTSETIYIFELRPTKTGDLIIPPISVNINGQVAYTQPIKVNVTQATGSYKSQSSASQQEVHSKTASSNQDYFVEATITNSAPYIGEQVDYTFRLYRPRNPSLLHRFQRTTYELPVFNNFWNEHEAEQVQGTTLINGGMYEVYEVRKILFPTMHGPTIIGPTKVVIPGMLLESDIILETEPQQLEIKSYPSNAPENFSGAVGEFIIKTEVDTTRSTVNSPITLTVELTGAGNIDALPEPIWPNIEDWRSFNGEVTVNIDSAFDNYANWLEGSLTGSRIYERILVPDSAGEFIIPPIEYTYLNPVTSEYVTISSKSVSVNIEPGVNQSNGPSAVNSRESVERLASDIRHIKPVPTRLENPSQVLIFQKNYWVAWGSLLAILIIYTMWIRHKKQLTHNTSHIRNLRAYKNAQRKLNYAQANNLEPLSLCTQILSVYLHDKLDQSVTGLTHKALADLLASNRINPSLSKRVNLFMISTENEKFTPADHQTEAEELFHRLNEVISDLEREFNA